MTETISINVGDKAPSFCLKDKDEKETKLSDLKGKWAVVYFYPKDLTPGCTKEAIEFTAHKEDFNKIGAEILGISADSTESHAKFTMKKDLTITLLSDPDREAINKFGVWMMKGILGSNSFGVERATFIIDPDGNIAHAWRSVKVDGHVEEVLTTLKNLKK